MNYNPFTSHPYQQATTSTSAKQASPNDKLANIQVSELLPERHRKRRASLIKLTDECLAAINDAIRNEWRIRLTVNGENIRIHVGNGTASPTIFQCTQQALAGSMDAICKDPTTANAYQTVSSINTKLAVNATEKTFAETREKAQKLAEEESKRGAKDVMVKKDPMAKFRAKNPYKPTSTLKTVSGSTLAPVTINNQQQKRISPPFPSLSANRTASPSLGVKNGVPPKPANLPIQNRQELLKKPLRERCVHLLATGKYKSKSDLLERLNFEGAPKSEPMAEFLAAAGRLVKELAEYDSQSDSLALCPQFHKEINLRWPWFLSSEREYLRRLIGITHPTDESTSVAPTRRNERERAATPPNAADRLGVPSNGRERSGSFNKMERPALPKINELPSDLTVSRSRSGSFNLKPNEQHGGSSIEQKNLTVPTTERLIPPPGRERTASFSRTERIAPSRDKIPTKEIPVSSKEKALVKGGSPLSSKSSKETIIPSKSSKETMLPLKMPKEVSTVSKDKFSTKETSSKDKLLTKEGSSKDKFLSKDALVSLKSAKDHSTKPIQKDHSTPKTVQKDHSTIKTVPKDYLVKPVQKDQLTKPVQKEQKEKSKSKVEQKPEPKMEKELKPEKVPSQILTPQPSHSTKLTPKEGGNQLTVQQKIKRSPLISSSTPSSVTSTDSSVSRKRLPAHQSPVSRPHDSSPLKAKRPRLEVTDDFAKVSKSPLGEKKSINDKVVERMGVVQNGAQNGVENSLGGKTTTLQEWKRLNELEKEFPVVRDSKQALKYHDLFEVDYPQYRKCHDELTRISKKFNDLKKQFDQAPSGSNEQEELLRRIQQAYDRYQADSRFTDTKRQHAHLHARLSLIKLRVTNWEQHLKHSKEALPRLEKTEGYRRERSASPGGSTTYSNSAASTTSVESLGERARLDADLF